MAQPVAARAVKPCDRIRQAATSNSAPPNAVPPCIATAPHTTLMMTSLKKAAMTVTGDRRRATAREGGVVVADWGCWHLLGRLASAVPIGQ
jgi:hypothetical protein